ncbi:MAG: divalent-cation tolerance protein CutA [candidate division WOR-3 bacterium]
MKKPIIIFTTYPNRASAQKAIKSLIENRLAACIQIIGPITSYFVWQRRAQQAKEYLVLIKSSLEKYREIETAITKNHPYDTPEIIAVPVNHGLNKYLKWLYETIS